MYSIKRRSWKIRDWQHFRPQFDYTAAGGVTNAAHRTSF